MTDSTIQMSIELADAGDRWAFVLDGEPIIQIDKMAVSSREVATDLCEALIHTLNTGIEIGRALKAHTE